MTTIKQTPQQRANTEYALHNWWPTVPPDEVIWRLGDWRSGCGTLACFGGHLAKSPHFRAMGVVDGLRGEPMLVEHPTLPTYAVSRHLFGDPELFVARGGSSADALCDGTDHEVVTNRLQWLLANSEVTL